MNDEIRADEITGQHTIATGLHAPAFLRVKHVERDDLGWITVTFWDGSTRTLSPATKVRVKYPSPRSTR